MCVYPLHRLDKYQTKAEILNVNFALLKGMVDNSEFKKIKPHHENTVSFWYIANIFFTETHSGSLVIYKPNMFSDKIIVTVFGMDHVHNTTFTSNVSMKLSDIDVSVQDGIGAIQCKHFFQQHFDTNTNKLKLDIHCPPYSATIHMDIKDYTTNFPALLPQLSHISAFTQFQQGNCPNVWGTDNPMFGDITHANINGMQSDSGTMWSENMIAFNNYFLADYNWTMVLTEDWLVYLLWFGNTDEIENNIINIRPIMIKDRRNDKMICCGVDTFTSLKMLPFTILDKIVQPKQMHFKSDQNYGGESLNYSIYFKCNGFEYSLTTFKTRRVVLLDYYDSHDVDESKLTSWEKEYYARLKNLQYAQYISEVDVVIKYEGEVHEFRTQSVIDGIFKIDPSIPSQMNCS